MMCLENLIAAFNSKNFAALTISDLNALVEHKFIRSETAARLAEKAGYVS